MKRFFLFLLLVFIVIQFFRPEKNNGQSPASTHINTVAPMSDSVQVIFKKACNDCHSNKTNYPWYANVQPVTWWLADHVKDGKRELNVDSFASYSLRKQYRKLQETIEQVKEGKMPLNSYTWIHNEAKLTDAEKSVITNWASASIDAMEAKYPIDSLKRKK
jgi:hypothetical protein